MITLTPAYGNDYKSKKEVLAAINDGKDFIIADVMHPYSGKPCNKSDLKVSGETSVKVRYKKLTQVTVVDL